MERLFVAVWPSEPVCEALMELPRKDRRGVRWVKPENWHTTLHFLGDGVADLVGERLDHISFDPIDISYGPGTDVFFERVLVVPVHGLDRVATVVSDATADLGTARRRKRFAGHLTAARIRRDAHLVDLVGRSFTATQTVDTIALVRSTLRPDGPKYETIETWRGRAPQGGSGGSSGTTD